MAEQFYLGFAAILAAAMLAPAVVFLSYSFTHRDMRFWKFAAAGYFAMFLASMAAPLREFLPVILYTLVANVFFGLTYLLSIVALRILKNYDEIRNLEFFIFFIFIGAAIFVYLEANVYSYRVAVVSFGIATFSLMIFTITLRTFGSVNVVGDLAIAFFGVLNFLITLVRGFVALFPDQFVGSPFASIDRIFFVWAIAAVFLFAFGLFSNGSSLIARAMALNLEKERSLGAQLRDALDGQRNLQKLILHELKRPVNSISTTIQALLSEGREPERSDVVRLKKLTGEAQSYLEGIGEFDDIYTLFEAPNFSHMTVRGIVADLRTKWGVEVSVTKHAEDLLIYADPLLLEIAVGNLIDNALKFAETRGGVSVQVHSNSKFVIFDVIDDGAGIPMTEWGDVWNKFYKIGGPSSHVLRGCGLGLYVTKKVAEVHEGHVAVMSRSPSVIRLALPLEFGGYFAESG
ncbi:MAG: HAMP domain-containing histidine kinase [Marivivens sp.]|nr:HAMP domain-containing histidine kinase [Marivivens sp.]